MKRLSGLDASFLYLETPSQLLHVCGLLVLQPDSVPGGYSFSAMKERMARQAGAIPEFRQKLRQVPLNLDHPVWVDDQDFDIDLHVHRMALPLPGGPTELADVTGHLAGIPLDRSRPLWDMWIIEGLEDGRIAVFLKMHHATVDGTSGMGLLAHLCSLEPEQPPEPVAPSRESAPGEVELLARAVIRNSTRPLKVAKLLAPTVGALAGTMNRARKGTAMAAPLTAPRTSFNATITGRRTIAYVDLPLDEVKAVKNAVEGATVNDVVLTLCGGALRRYLEERDELPASSLLATVPVSVRGTSKAGGVNQVSALFARLGTDIEDPGERLRFVSEGNRRAKDHNKAIPAEALQEWAELAAPKTFGMAVRIYSGLRLAEKHPVVHNLVISNVPGPPVPIYFLGALVEGMYPLGPVFHGAGLNITVISSNGSLHFGIIACADLAPELWDLAHHFPDELAALRKACSVSSTD
jgi:diacylglycerol O-acyltransferase / wax synthase